MSTVFEKLWAERPDDAIFLSEELGVGAWPDAYPKLPLQTVIIPKEHYGTGKYELLPCRVRLLVDELSATIMHASVDTWREITGHNTDMERTESRAHKLVSGYGVQDHPHVVIAPAPRGDFAKMWAEMPAPEIRMKYILQAKKHLTLGEVTKDNLLIRLANIANISEVEPLHAIDAVSTKI